VGALKHSVDPANKQEQADTPGRAEAASSLRQSGYPAEERNAGGCDRERYCAGHKPWHIRGGRCAECEVKQGEECANTPGHGCHRPDTENHGPDPLPRLILSPHPPIQERLSDSIPTGRLHRGPLTAQVTA
jgi:hypothetical protein